MIVQAWRGARKHLLSPQFVVLIRHKHSVRKRLLPNSTEKCTSDDRAVHEWGTLVRRLSIQRRNVPPVQRQSQNVQGHMQHRQVHQHQQPMSPQQIQSWQQQQYQQQQQLQQQQLHAQRVPQFAKSGRPHAHMRTASLGDSGVPSIQIESGRGPPRGNRRMPHPGVHSNDNRQQPQRHGHAWSHVQMLPLNAVLAMQAGMQPALEPASAAPQLLASHMPTAANNPRQMMVHPPNFHPLQQLHIQQQQQQQQQQGVRPEVWIPRSGPPLSVPMPGIGAGPHLANQGTSGNLEAAVWPHAPGLRAPPMERSHSAASLSRHGPHSRPAQTAGQGGTRTSHQLQRPPLPAASSSNSGAGPHRASPRDVSLHRQPPGAPSSSGAPHGGRKDQPSAARQRDATQQSSVEASQAPARTEVLMRRGSAGSAAVQLPRQGHASQAISSMPVVGHTPAQHATAAHPENSSTTTLLRHPPKPESSLHLMRPPAMLGASGIGTAESARVELPPGAASRQGARPASTQAAQLDGRNGPVCLHPPGAEGFSNIARHDGVLAAADHVRPASASLATLDASAALQVSHELHYCPWLLITFVCLLVSLHHLTCTAFTSSSISCNCCQHSPRITTRDCIDERSSSPALTHIKSQPDCVRHQERTKAAAA